MIRGLIALEDECNVLKGQSRKFVGVLSQYVTLHNTILHSGQCVIGITVHRAYTLQCLEAHFKSPGGCY